MAVPEGLEPQAAMPVHGRNGFRPGHDLAFGEFRVDQVSRSSPRTSRESHAIGDGARYRLGGETADQRLRFRVREGAGQPWRAWCGQSAAQERSTLPVVGEITHGYRASLSCTVVPEADSAALWHLDLAEGRGAAGTLQGGGASFQVVSTERMDGSRIRTADATGYVFRLDGRAVAAVDVLNGGAVRMDPSLPAEQRAAIAASMVALMLRADLERELDG
ncbi:MAG TPA: hypothetical protein VFH27_12085 [Longimicrobiaceae bacterium]|nr:hypothetical protein [Longimicrobiaceae bacterium]